MKALDLSRPLLVLVQPPDGGGVAADGAGQRGHALQVLAWSPRRLVCWQPLDEGHAADPEACTDLDGSLSPAQPVAQSPAQPVALSPAQPVARSVRGCTVQKRHGHGVYSHFRQDLHSDRGGI